MCVSVCFDTLLSASIYFVSLCVRLCYAHSRSLLKWNEVHVWLCWSVSFGVIRFILIKYGCVQTEPDQISARGVTSNVFKCLNTNKKKEETDGLNTQLVPTDMDTTSWGLNFESLEIPSSNIGEC